MMEHSGDTAKHQIKVLRGLNHLGFTFSDLFCRSGLERLDQAFFSYLRQNDVILAEQLEQKRQQAQSKQLAYDTSHTEFLLELARYLERFLLPLFDNAVRGEHWAEEMEQNKKWLHTFQRNYLIPRVAKRPHQVPSDADLSCVGKLINLLHPVQDDVDDHQEALAAAKAAMIVLSWHHHVVGKYVLTEDELQLQQKVLPQALASFHDQSYDLSQPEQLKAGIEHCLAAQDVVHRYWMELRSWSIYHLPKSVSLDRLNLVPTLSREQEQGIFVHHSPTYRHRTGFQLTDKRMHRQAIAREANYCLICHPRSKDSCRHGLKNKQNKIQQDALGNTLQGCPLHERISEMNLLAREGAFLAALAMICLDNPMCPGTGHRICNDCMKGCIFQKQDPVNIPEIETHCLTSVLQLPYGFELYDLLLRYNPLDMDQPIVARKNSYTVAVIGSGPAGYTLAHYLTRSGCQVIHMDGLKIESLPNEFIGDLHQPPQPVESIDILWEDLAERKIGGFGGVAEYGITVRWDKNFLKIIHLSLARRQQYQLIDGVLFGGTITIQDCWERGIDHIALATGAGKPTMIDFQDNLAPGIRTASDFLMSLQLSGSFQEKSTALVQVELPALVLGGGLTAIDTATELLAYYPVQVEKILRLSESIGIEKTLEACSELKRSNLETMLSHAQTLRLERAKSGGGQVLSLLQHWGGVTVVYRKKMVQSPAYRLNHEELMKALEEGIGFIENTTAQKALRDEHGHLCGLECIQMEHSSFILPAKSIFMAAGTKPNIIPIHQDLSKHFRMKESGGFYQPHCFDESHSLIVASPEQEAFSFLTDYKGPEGQTISFFGDNHPSYAGNVVKAMASAKYGYTSILNACEQVHHATISSPVLVDFKKHLTATIVHTKVLQPHILEIVVHAPAATQHFQPGQFYRLQRYQANEPQIGSFHVNMEPLALTGAWVDKKLHRIGLVVLEMGLSSKLCSTLRPGEQVVLMGPCGTPTFIPQKEFIVLCGGGLGNAVLLSIGKKMRELGNRVIYFAAYKKRQSLFYKEDLEACADQVIWSVDEGECIPINPTRIHDLSLRGNIVQAIEQCGSSLHTIFPLNQTHRLICIGSNRMMAAIEQARNDILKPYLGHPLFTIASVNSPMQCMMKEICGQCIQRHYDPIRKEHKIVFSCKEQDQASNTVDWQSLQDRLQQNEITELITNQWWEKMIQPYPTISKQ